MVIKCNMSSGCEAEEGQVEEGSIEIDAMLLV